MARYIFIDQNSGYIWGDSADIDGKIVTGTPVEVVTALDASLEEDPDRFEYWQTYKSDAERTYDVYRADVGGSDAIGPIRDGTDHETIEAVLRNCEYVTSIVRTVKKESDEGARGDGPAQN
jgi:hypothetical protein